MKTIFIINPKAGQGKGLDKLITDINETATELGLEEKVDVYMTKSQGDAERFAKGVCKQLQEMQDPDKKVRLIACGGDGTFNEVINGAFGCDNVTVGVFPIGTGNDFVRNFPDAGDFLNIKAQLLGDTRKLDCISYEGMLDGEVQKRYGANMFNIGFDCTAADRTATLKEKPFLAGSVAYLAAVGVTFIQKKTTNLTVEMDGEEVHNGPLLLTSIANGCYCGGGVRSNPLAELSDGVMDVNVIFDMSRGRFLKLFPHYQKGTHMELPEIEKLIKHGKCQKLVIIPNDGMMRLCIDGEISDAERIEFNVVHEGFNFNVPKVI